MSYTPKRKSASQRMGSGRRPSPGGRRAPSKSIRRLVAPSAMEEDPQIVKGAHLKKKSKRSTIETVNKGVDRGVIRVQAAPYLPKRIARPERSVITGTQQFPALRIYASDTMAYAAGRCLNPGNWTQDNGSAVGCSPLKGLAKNQRIKDSINVHGWVMRFSTDTTAPFQTSVDNSYRFIILQLTGSETEIAGLGVAPAISQFLVNGDANTGIDQFYKSKKGLNHQFTASYRVLYDQVHLNNTRNHSFEIHLGRMLMTWSGSDTLVTDQPVVGRLIFYCLQKVGLAGTVQGQLDVRHRLEYSDE